MNDTLQIIIAVLGIVSQILLLAKHFYGREVEGQGRQTPATLPVGTSREARPRATKSLLDLSFVLLCSAFFALLLTDSLIISGRNPSAGPGTIIAVFTITFVVVITMSGAWFLGRTELVTAFLAL